MSIYSPHTLQPAASDGAPRRRGHVPAYAADPVDGVQWGAEWPGGEAAAPPRPGTLRAMVDNVRATEGDRGLAARKALAFKYAAYAATIAVCVGVVNAAFAGTSWASAPKILAVAVTVITVTAAAGTVFASADRPDIIDQFRHYLFGLTLFPATGIAIFSAAMRSYSADPSNGDNFIGLLSNSLPMIYAFTAFAPALVFVKVIAGMRTINRSTLDDQETIAAYTRQDGYFA